MKRVVFVVLLLLFLTLWMIIDARAAFDCAPRTALTPAASGTAYIQVTTPAGRAWGYWCPLPQSASTPAGKMVWAPQWQIVLNKFSTAPDPLSVATGIASAPDLVAAISAAASAAAVTPAVGSQDEYQYKLLKFNVCTALATPPYLAPLDPLPANYCGAAPMPPAPVADIWRALGTAIYTAANGKLVAPTGTKASVGALCDGTVPAIPGAVTYLPLVGGSPAQVTSCKKASQ